MQRNSKLVLAGAIVLTGLAISSLFQRERPTAGPMTDPASELVLRDDTGPHYLTESPAAAATGTLALPPLPGPPPPPEVNRPAESGPPMVNLSPFEWVDPAPPAISWSDPTESFDSWTVDPLPASPEDEEFAAEDADTGATAGARPASHVIVDGDTLASLATRYLGDASRAHELFEANRDVLSDPDVLPIGRRLTLPSVEDAIHDAAETPGALAPVVQPAVD
jgi:phage tail protein X